MRSLSFGQGGDWGAWAKFPNYPRFSIRTACGDDSQMKGYLVSSEDWQIRNGYAEALAIVWRAQFFDDRIGKNSWTGWMTEHFQAGQTSDAWTVVAGHCGRRNVTDFQIKCMARRE